MEFRDDFFEQLVLELRSEEEMGVSQEKAGPGVGWGKHSAQREEQMQRQAKGTGCTQGPKGQCS